jgi:hypothetical protein
MAIDEQTIIDGVSSLEVAGNQQGLIPAFGVYLTSATATFYNRLSYEFANKLGNNLREEAQMVLMNAAWVCGYNTFRGIQTSVEWKGLIEPMISNPTDKLHASIAVCNALGWCKWKIIDVIPGKSCKIRAEEGYEAELFLKTYGKSSHPVCYMLCAVISALMDLSYGTEYPTGIYTFHTIETKCRSMGDDCCEFESKLRE